MRSFNEVLEELQELLGTKPVAWIINEFFVGHAVDITVEREIDRPVTTWRGGYEDVEYEGTGCYEDVHISGVISGVDVTCGRIRVLFPKTGGEYVDVDELEADTTVALIECAS